MTDLLTRFHAWFDPFALRMLKWLNGAAGTIAAALLTFNALHPNFPAEVSTALHLTPMRGFVFGLVWCGVVAYVVKRAAKAA